MRASCLSHACSLLLLGVAVISCSARDGKVTTPPCDGQCQDQVAALALRETLKLAFNLTLQGKPVGTYDLPPAPCLQGGTVRISGTASSDAAQGATIVDLKYELDKCGYLQKDNEAKENYDIVISGIIVQKGTLAVQPTSTSAVIITSESVSITGRVYDPYIDYAATSCPLQLGQNGNKLAGKLCGREVAVDL